MCQDPVTLQVQGKSLAPVPCSATVPHQVADPLSTSKTVMVGSGP